MRDGICRHCGAAFSQSGVGRNRSWCFDCLPPFGTTSDYNKRAQRLWHYQQSGRHGACCGLPRERPRPKAPKPPRPGPLTWSGNRRSQELAARVYAEETNCGICGDHVDQTLHYNDRMARSVDHIVPVSLGGAVWDRANVRLAHRSCNSRAGNALQGQVVYARAALWMASRLGGHHGEPMLWPRLAESHSPVP